MEGKNWSIGYVFSDKVVADHEGSTGAVWGCGSLLTGERRSSDATPTKLLETA